MTQLVNTAFEIINPQGRGQCVLVCEHASNYLPESLNNLGLDEPLLHSHISWDPGALEVARRLSKALDAPLIKASVSRLAYDCNRPPSSPDAIVEHSEIHPVPGNIKLTDLQRQQRIEQIYQPFRDAVAKLITQRSDQQPPPLLVTIHSFVPVYKGVKRDVEIGILHDQDTRLADFLLRDAATDKAFLLRRNEPYGPDDGVTHTLQEHGIANGIANVMIEIRNDLIDDSSGQQRLAAYLSEKLQSVPDYSVTTAPDKC